VSSHVSANSISFHSFTARELRFGTQTPHLKCDKANRVIFEILSLGIATGSSGLHTVLWHSLKIIFRGFFPHKYDTIEHSEMSLWLSLMCWKIYLTEIFPTHSQLYLGVAWRPFVTSNSFPNFESKELKFYKITPHVIAKKVTKVIFDILPWGWVMGLLVVFKPMNCNSCKHIWKGANASECYVSHVQSKVQVYKFYKMEQPHSKIHLLYTKLKMTVQTIPHLITSKGQK